MFNSKICRICLKSCDNSLHIFGGYYLKNYKKLKECLEEICDISVSPDDNLPEYICLNCTKLLEQSCNFRILARKNDCLLHDILKRECKEENYDVIYESEDSLVDNKQISRSESIDKKDNSSEDLGTINTESVEQANEDEHFSNIIEKVDPHEDLGDPLYIQDNEEYIEVEYDISCSRNIQEPQDIKKEEDVKENLDIDNKLKIKNFECKICGKKFAYQKNKMNHEEKHIKGGNRQCHICLIKFYTNYDLMRHVYGHTKEKIFRCNTCGKTYFTKPELNRHLKTHSNVKNFKCTYCGKAFHELGVLNSHTKSVHLNEKNHQCNICGKFFQTPSKVRRHQRSIICSQTKSGETLNEDEDKFIKRRTLTVCKRPQRTTVKGKNSCSQFKVIKSQKIDVNS